MSAAGKLRALVLEDEWAARNYLVELVEASGLASVVAAAADTEQAWAGLRGDGAAPAVDVAFVDVRLAGEPADDAGLAWLRAAAAEAAGRVHFVLTTASREHALEAFELGARDYLVKPFTDERVAQCLRRLAGAGAGPRPPEPPQRVIARHGRRLMFVPIDDVWAFEAAERLSHVHAAAGTFDVDLSLSALAASLGPSFLRAHRNWLVRLGAVRELEREGGEVQLAVGPGGLRVPVARDRATQVREALLASAIGLRRLPP
ncbi:MAG TPA: LytTR family DNA-binding domain-containing protein [Polyangiaceae bacterium]|nr:LytTR family DNA-binding domain-containing protein [Polyangiaceae bacterium]